MTAIDKLEQEVQRLSREELAAFRDWFRKYDSDEWDREIEQDVRSGKLDGLAQEAIAEHKAGRTKEI
jgi:KaiC/GvpD/RAD55 family RecA-like ATPase